MRLVVSQPFACAPSMSSKPALHVRTSQVPVEHDSLAFARLHVVPQLAQFVSVVSDVSQPFELVPSQLPKPLEQLPSVHTPPGQLSVALSRAHTAPQLPQFVSVVVDASQPFMSLPSQLPEPGLHEAIEQAPVAHVAVAPVRLHGTPQPPQSVSVRSEVSQPVESVESQSS